MTDTPQPPPSVLESFGLARGTLEPITAGHINLSFFARRDDGAGVVLQRVNPIFPPDVHDDIDAVTRHLDAKGIVTPRLLPTAEGSNRLETEGAVWRLMTRIGGETHEGLGSAGEAREAGRVLGAFHAALADFDRPLAASRPSVHDLERHLAHLARALATHRGHPAAAEVAGIDRRIRARAARLAAPADAPLRLVHGDPKISNVVFAGGRAICLIDLDTIGRFPVALELGDAFRSWCNLSAEDAPDARFSPERFAAGLAGYRAGAGALLTRDEARAVPEATLGIALELAARFAADALNEAYFAWDRQRFEGASAHNLARAAAQLGLAESIASALPALRELVVTEL